MAQDEKTKLRLEIAHVLFIDLVGYSKLSIDDQRRAVERLNDAVQSTAAFQHAEAAARLAKIPTGDGMALVFYDSPESPVECAMEISRKLSTPDAPRLRMGIHSGPISGVVDVSGRSNVAGEGINIAQRVMDCGDAGHILLSNRLAQDLSQFKHWRPHLHDLGECELKHGTRLGVVNFFTSEIGNSDRPSKLDHPTATARTQVAAPRKLPRYWVVASAPLILALVAAIFFLRARTGRQPAISTANIPEKSIAVLPLENLSQDPENAYFADGVHEEILTRLAKISELKVISRTSAAKFRASPETLRAIAERLGVANIVEGSVQKSGNAVRVNVQLINARSDVHLWAETYDRSLTDVFQIESDIAKAIANKLKAKLTGLEEEAITTQPTQNSEAHQLYLKGRYFWNKRTSDGLKTAIDHFNQAIEKDPAYGPAYAGLADAYAVLPNYSQTPGKEAYPKAEAAALKALEINDRLAEAHISLANVRIWHRWGRGAESEFKRGLQLNPNYSTGHQWYSIYLSVLGRNEEAIVEMEKARELDPFSIIIATELGCPYLYSKQYDQAIEYFSKGVEMDPDFPFAHFALAEGLDRKGRYDEALEAHDKAIELARRGGAFDLAGGDAPRAWYALTGPLQNTYAARGGPNYWQRRLESTKQSYERGTTTATAVAEIYAILGDNEQALAWLERAFREADDFLVFVNIQPEFEKLRTYPPYQTLIQKIFTEPAQK
jgi:TolB-like protein/Tfp pilus assembly protein PilF